MLYRKFIFFQISVASFYPVLAEGSSDFDKTAKPLQLEASLVYMDNYNPLSVADLSAKGAKVGFSGKLVTTSESIWLQADYSANHQQYNLDDSTTVMEESFQSAHLDLKSRLFIANKWSVDVNAKIQKHDELLGTGLSRIRPNVTVSDSYQRSVLGLHFNYGSEISKRSFRFGFRSQDQDYASHNIYSDLFDLTQNIFDLGFGYRVSEDTRIVAVFEHRELDYDIANSLDSTLSKVLLGVEWQASGKSEVSAKLGMYQHRYDTKPDNSGATWELGAVFFPREDFSIALDSTQLSIAGDSELSTDTIERDIAVTLTYFYSDVWRYGFKAQTRQSQYQEPENDRTADQNQVSVFANLTWLEHQRVTLSLLSETLDDELRNIDYKQNRIDLSWQYDF